MDPDINIAIGVSSPLPQVVAPQMASPMEAPPSVTPLSMSSGTWTTGLCGCFEDPSNCLITLFCPCVTFGQNAEIIDKGTTSCVRAGTICYSIFQLSMCCCCYTCTYRSKLRGQTAIPGDQCADCCAHFWCPFCALCQEFRELKNRGLDPSIGWIANEQKRSQKRGVTTPPVVPAGTVR